MRVLFCGDREWDDVQMIGEVLQKYNPKEDVIINGYARGADIIASILGKWMGFVVEDYPADWEKYKKAAGPIRNKEMLDTGLDKVNAFHDDLSRSKGTRDMVKIAGEAGIEIDIYMHK